jgi:uncharacterized protein (DUF1697 family)
MSAVYLALLRAINLGPTNKIAMPDLVKLFVETGCDNVRTYIQSGNVIFEASSALAERLPNLIQEEIQRRFGFNVPVILRTVREMRDALRSNPFSGEGAAEDTLHVMFLAEQPKPATIKCLDPLRSPPNRFVVRAKEVYLLFPHGFARNKLSGAYFDSKLGTTGTVRTWRTVKKLLELMETPGSGDKNGRAKQSGKQRGCAYGQDAGL